MKAKKVEETIVYYFKDLKHPKKGSPFVWEDACHGAANLAAAEILELCEADKNDALQVQDAAWHDIEDKHLADLATAQAQVAVMAEALENLEWIKRHTHYDVVFRYCPWCHADKERGHKSDCLRQTALFAAPKVLSVKDIELKDGIFLATGYRGTPGDWVKVIVLDKQGEGG